MTNCNKPHSQAGLAAIEALLMLAVFALLLGVAMPAAGSKNHGTATTEIIQTYERVTAACQRHLADTGRVALEFSTPTAEHQFAAPRYHHLANSQSYPGWQGPYLDQPLSMGDNPFHGSVFLMADLMDFPALGFNFPGKPEMAGQGQYLVFERIPESVAQAIDQHLDEKTTNQAWQTQGRVEYSLDNDGTLSLFILVK